MIDNVLIHHLEHNIPIHINEWNRLRQLIRSTPNQVTEQTLLLAIELSVSMTIQTAAHLTPSMDGSDLRNTNFHIQEEESRIDNGYLQTMQIPWEVVEVILQASQYKIEYKVGHLMHILLLRNGISIQVFNNWVQETKWQGSGTVDEILGGEDSCFLMEGNSDCHTVVVNGRNFGSLNRNDFADTRNLARTMDFDKDKLRILVRRFPHLSPYILLGAIRTQQYPAIMKLIVDEGFRSANTDYIHQGRHNLMHTSGKLLKALVSKGRVDVIRMFLVSEPPLILKEDVQSLELLRVLVEGANENAYRQDQQHQHPHTQVSSCKHADFVSLARLFIQLDPKALEAKATDWRGAGSIPLHVVCQGRCVDLFKVFVEEGVATGVPLRGGLLMKNRYNLNGLEMIMSNKFRSAGKTYHLLMYLIGQKILERTDVVHLQLLHRIVQHRDPEFEQSVMRLIQLAPEALSSANELGNFPIHSTIVDCYPSRRITFASINPNMLALLLQEGLNQDTFIEHDSFGGLLVPNKVGETTLDLIMRFGREMETGEIENFEGCNAKFWQCLDLCWKRTKELPFLQAAAFVVSSARFRTILNRYDCIGNADEHDNHPLHFALEKRRSFLSSSSLFSSSCIQDILNANPQAAATKNTKGQLPLHIALHGARGNFDWYNVIRPILNANYEAIDESDPANGLFPYLLAATNKSHIESTYHLLRHSPQLLISQC